MTAIFTGLRASELRGLQWTDVDLSRFAGFSTDWDGDFCWASLRGVQHGAVQVDGNAYSVPWRLIGEQVRVTVGAETIRIRHGSREVAVHAELKGRHGRLVDDRHLTGLVGTTERLSIGLRSLLRKTL